MLQTPLNKMSMNLLFNDISPSTSITPSEQQHLPQFYSSSLNESIFTRNPFATSIPSTSSTMASSSSSIINPSSASTLLVAAAAKAAATTATILNQQQQERIRSCQNSSIDTTKRTNDEQKIDELLLPALIGHEALPIHLKLLYNKILPNLPSEIVKSTIIKTGWSFEDFERGYIKNISNLLQNNSSQQPPSQPQQLQQSSSIWRCANLPTTLQILNAARENYPNYISTIDTLRQSLTQTIFVSLINASTPSTSTSSSMGMNGIEMPAIASLAPNNTSLHLNTQQFQQHQSVNVADNDPNEPVCNQILPNGNPLQQTVIPQISPSLNLSPTSSSFESRRDSLPYSISSPAKSEFSINTDASSADIKSDMGSLTIKTEKPEKFLRHAKKRVMCEKCQKSFCDKGALKIHNSSVHLREMHICTIPGCTKQFPSKRSRNRHSNNPNMHTDAGRRRNCRSAVTSAIKTEPPSELPQPQHQQNVQNESTHSILSLLQKLIPTPSQQASSPQTTVFPTQISAPSEPMPFPQHPLPLPQNSELNGLLKFMIAQRSKATLC